MYKVYLLLGVVLVLFQTKPVAQEMNMDSYVHEGELGVLIGGATYFGDLNTSDVSRPKVNFGLFYKKQYSNYIGVKIAINYALLGYSDAYSNVLANRIRNLSFNTDVWEISASGDFNFFKFYPGFKQYAFTPYVGIGVGLFSFDPYTYYRGIKYYLRTIGTEGQGNSLYPSRKKYSPVAACLPISFGFKFNINEFFNFFVEAGYRFTSTDYMDDVSTTYAPDAFPNINLANGTIYPNIGYILQDRSFEVNRTNVGTKGRQRGQSNANDSYLFTQIGISFNINGYRCPQPFKP